MTPRASDGSQARRRGIRGSRQRVVALLVAALLGRVESAAAGIPCVVDDAGVPLTWHTMPVVYNLDPGPLAVLPNRVISAAGASEFVQEAGHLWEMLPTAAVRFATGPTLPADVDGTNYDEVLGVCGDGLSPVVFDGTGAIIDAVLGRGASAFVLGFTLHDCGEVAAPTLPESSVVLNGTVFAHLSADEARQAFVGVLAHELGHVLNLCHSRLHPEFVDDGDADNDAFVPIMFPFRSNDDPGAATRPRFDDAAMLSMLYPAPGFFDTTGTIGGHVTSGRAGQPVSGAEVIVRSTADPLGTAQWTTSGWLRLESVNGILASIGDAIPAIDGSYQASGLPPGSYTVRVDGGVTGAGAEFFSGIAESDDPFLDPPATAAVLSVDAGSVRTDATVTLDRRVSSPLGETQWNIRWRGSVAISGARLAFPARQLPTGSLEFLSTGRYRCSPIFELGGAWAPRGRRGVRHRALPAAVEALLDPGVGVVGIDTVTGRGRANRRLSRIHGRFVARGVLLFPRARFSVRLRYQGVRKRGPRPPGRLPLLPGPLGTTPD